jgi:hypothetical protein
MKASLIIALAGVTGAIVWWVGSAFVTETAGHPGVTMLNLGSLVVGAAIMVLVNRRGAAWALIFPLSIAAVAALAIGVVTHWRL